MKNKNTTRWIVTGLIVIAALVMIGNAFKIVPTGYTGVRVRLGQVSEENIPSGVALKIPFVDSIRLVNNKQQDVTIEGQIWSETSERTALYYEGINITYRINTGRSAWLVANVNDYEHTLLTSSFVSSSVKAASFPRFSMRVRSVTPVRKPSFSSQTPRATEPFSVTVFRTR